MSIAPHTHTYSQSSEEDEKTKDNRMTQVSSVRPCIDEKWSTQFLLLLFKWCDFWAVSFATDSFSLLIYLLFIIIVIWLRIEQFTNTHIAFDSVWYAPA